MKVESLFVMCPGLRKDTESSVERSAFFSPIIFRKLDSSIDFLAQLSDLWADSDWYEFVEESHPPGLSRCQKF